MDTKNQIDVLKIIDQKKYDFESKYNVVATDIVLPYFVKDVFLKYYSNYSNNGLHGGLSRNIKIMDMKIHWTMIERIDIIECFNCINS